MWIGTALEVARLELEAHPLPAHARRDHDRIARDIQAEQEAWG